ncbi:WEB family protein at5g55860, partial [Phtheirospermum japonicum]
RVLAKKTQLHLAKKQLTKLNEQLQNAETTKSQALLELEKAKRTVYDLAQKLKITNESKNSAVSATEAFNHQAKQFAVANNHNNSNGSSNVDQETARAHYIALVTELDTSKKELRKIRQEHNASIEAKAKAEKLEAEAEKAAKLSTARAGELSEEISSVRDSIQQAKLASVQAKGDETNICADKDEQKQSYKARLEESAKGLHALKKDIDPELVKNLETRLAETFSEIEAVRGEMESTQAADLDSVKTVTMDLNGAKESINRVVEEESSLRSLVESLKLELDKIKNEHFELKGKEAETESIADNLHAKLVKAKSELEEALAKEAQIRSASDEMTASIDKLALETENAKHEAQEMKQKAEVLKREAEATRIELEEAQNKLKAATSEAEEAKADEAKALDRIKILSEKTNAMRTSKSEPGARIAISRDEFESLSRKVEESEKLADLKVIAAMAQIEAVKAGENEAMKRLEAIEKEIEDTKGATHETLKKAEMAEVAKKAVEGELRRWREREQKKAEETASRILSETERLFEVPITRSHKVEQTKGQMVETRKLTKNKTLFSKKALLMTSLSNVFRKKKYRVEGGSPSYLPGEKPVW